MSARTRIVVNPAAGERSDRLSPTRTLHTVHGAGRGEREPRVDGCGATRLTVVRGRMAVTCDGTLAVLEPGESITVAPGVAHAWWSTRAGELCVDVETGDAQQSAVTGTTPAWRSWSWSSLTPTGWAPSVSR